MHVANAPREIRGYLVKAERKSNRSFNQRLAKSERTALTLTRGILVVACTSADIFIFHYVRFFILLSNNRF